MRLGAACAKEDQAGECDGVMQSDGTGDQSRFNRDMTYGALMDGRPRNFPNRPASNHIYRAANQEPPQALRNTNMPSNPCPLDIDDVLGTGRLSGKTWTLATEIPLEVADRMPHPGMSIPLFLAYRLPTIHSESTPLPDPVTCVICSKPSWSVDALLASPIPYGLWRSDAEDEVRDRWEARREVESIEHPTDPEQVLPLWVVNYWTVMARANVEQERWKAALEWVRKQEDSSERCAALALMARIPWGTKLWTVDSPDQDAFVGRLAEILSFKWLAETHMDNFAAYLNAVKPSEWWVGDVQLSTSLRSLSKCTKAQIDAKPELKRATERISAREAKRIVLPLNVGGNHWIVVHVDLTNQRLEYGVCF